LSGETSFAHRVISGPFAGCQSAARGADVSKTQNVIATIGCKAMRRMVDPRRKKAKSTATIATARGQSVLGTMII
jgi:hypothetical protein